MFNAVETVFLLFSYSSAPAAPPVTDQPGDSSPKNH